MKKTYIAALAIFITPFALGACSGAKEQLGLERSAPDEFAVVKRAPLEMPPSYYLRPPAPGAPRPQEQTTDVQARQTVFGEAQQEQPAEQQAAADGTTSSESLLLQQAGTGIADPSIRSKVDEETAEMKDYNRPVAEKLLGIGDDGQPYATVVDSKKESERLRKNMEEGKPVTEGETPYIED